MHIGSDLVQIREDLEVFFWLLVELLTEFGNVKKEWREEVLEDAKYLFDAAVDEDRTNECFKHIAHDLAGFKDLNLSIIHLEVLFERVADIAIQVVLFVKLLLLLLELPLGHLLLLCLLLGSSG